MERHQPFFDRPSNLDFSVDSLAKLMEDNGVVRVFFKFLSSNDNSKNQIYLAGHLADIGFLPTGPIKASESKSEKTANKRKVKFTTSIKVVWLDSSGAAFPAPDAKLIYYPQYPEVRLSGFLARTGIASNGWFDPKNKGRTPGRILMLGVASSETVYVWLAIPGSRIAKEIAERKSVLTSGVLHEIAIDDRLSSAESKSLLLDELLRINELDWIKGKRLDKDGKAIPYSAPNGGGYTLEAELGVTPNRYAEPDFLGWEIKQFGVTRCDRILGKPLTIMTPEPDGGFYAENGAEAFLRKFGYSSTANPDRIDFTGRHFAYQVSKRSGLRMELRGYEPAKNLISNAAGSIALLTVDDRCAASWSFAKIMEHWKRKHARAAYIPAIATTSASGGRAYSYCNNVRLFEGTSINRLLNAIALARVYYDPGINLKSASNKPKIKRRNQFRIKSADLEVLYEVAHEVILRRGNG